jgi:import inner membrane translocase subunit TIM21
MDAARSSLGLGPHRIASHAALPHLYLHILTTLTCNNTSTRLIMAAIYRPTEAIALLRPSFLLPRIQPCSTRRAPLSRMAFSTTQTTQATHSSTPNPSTPPQPQRKSITLTGDTGQVRWSDLSPGEKAVRTTQQSFNLVVVVVGILATVSFYNFSSTLMKRC